MPLTAGNFLALNPGIELHSCAKMFFCFGDDRVIKTSNIDLPRNSRFCDLIAGIFSLVDFETSSIFRQI